jgi:hypothetical protein
MHSLKTAFTLGWLVLDLTIRVHGPGSISESPLSDSVRVTVALRSLPAEPATNAPRMHFELRFNAPNWDPHELLPTLRLLMDSIDITLLSLKRPSDWHSRRFYGWMSDREVATGTRGEARRDKGIACATSRPFRGDRRIIRNFIDRSNNSRWLSPPGFGTVGADCPLLSCA